MDKGWREPYYKGMYSLVIVDDEPAIRRGLARHIDWTSMGFEVVESFEDGEDALAYLEHHHVDAVLTDIRMSVVSGLSLAKTIRDRGLETEVVILSGYKDFEYARSAMQSGVRAYLLKPTDEGELREVFDEVRASVAMRHRKGSAGMRRLVVETRRQLLTRIVDGSFEDTDEVANRWREAMFPPLTEDVRVSYAALRVPPECAERIRGCLRGISVDEAGRSTVALFEPPQLLHFLMVCSGVDGERDGADADAAAGCRDLIGSRVDPGLARLVEVVNEVRVSSARDLRLLSRRDGDQGPAMDSQRIRDFVKTVLETPPADAENLTRAVEGEITRCGGGVPQARHAAVDLVSGVLAACRRRAPERLPTEPVDYGALLRCSTVEEVCAWAAEVIRRIAERLPEQGRDHRRRAVERARAFICANLDRDVSLERVASRLYLSPAYLSRLFREESGQTFLDYVTETRMDRAIDLLTSRPGLSVADVARLVGYGDPKYFSRVFKARIGRTPSRYRRALAQS